MVWLNKKDCKKIFKNQKSLKIVIFDFFILKISKKLIWNERELLKNIIIWGYFFIEQLHEFMLEVFKSCIWVT